MSQQHNFKAHPISQPIGKTLLDRFGKTSDYMEANVFDCGTFVCNPRKYGSRDSCWKNLDSFAHFIRSAPSCCFLDDVAEVERRINFH